MFEETETQKVKQLAQVIELVVGLRAQVWAQAAWEESLYINHVPDHMLHFCAPVPLHIKPAHTEPPFWSLSWPPASPTATT